ncbi:MAG: phosphoribosylanthranilate isomerase [Candidatus Abyssobacteria bacterium SURF_5]|uniref:N-(5'-phosphoribosyl)anthranilate isomerase n=1 Tax=Abyssobacteria bacterium (strain SURF_5) TaxID=2093360 RepID=A0A3A4P6U8_ABYX5|nr:MAG: phosphoribosylanthranilate isomerase [Candidatus Abyssubacteria bacterium SURF_5]
MVRVKICGVTHLEDALWAAANGADAVGLIFAPSPRQVAPETAVAIRRRLPPFVSVVGVFVEPDPSYARDIFDLVGLDYIQYHGDDEERIWYAGFHPAQFIRVVSVAKEADLELIERSSAAYILLDTKVPGMAGGTGKVFDWTLATKAKTLGRPIILSGGLTPENVAEAIKVASPDAVDVSSGIEASPGWKDPQKVHDFIRRAKSYVA